MDRFTGLLALALVVPLASSSETCDDCYYDDASPSPTGGFDTPVSTNPPGTSSGEHTPTPEEPATPTQGSTGNDNATPTAGGATPEPNGVTDADNDGYSVAQGDCDDNNASVYPGATEIIEDGIDQDCDTYDRGNCRDELLGNHMFMLVLDLSNCDLGDEHWVHSDATVFIPPNAHCSGQTLTWGGTFFYSGSDYWTSLTGFGEALVDESIESGTISGRGSSSTVGVCDDATAAF